MHLTFLRTWAHFPLPAYAARAPARCSAARKQPATMTRKYLDIRVKFTLCKQHDREVRPIKISCVVLPRIVHV